ncbi:DNA-binding transcriptional regulator KdgR [Burkholderia perseverans]|uniref:DNA-binding transcriptional regulator KdgR n=1 Tax=Burkholderia perseverans TaxID=2615214 RepID=UPI001FED410E|nr:DNA-binding transcriptional regulator KdgR [Burkholderia perseverans]
MKSTPRSRAGGAPNPADPALADPAAGPAAEAGGDRTESVAAVGKVFTILAAMGASGARQAGTAIDVAELSQQLGMSRPGVQRLLQTLVALGYVAREPDPERYRLTMQLFELGAKALESVDLVREADLEMRRIAAATREAIHLGALDDDAIIYIHKIDADYGLRMQSRIGRRNPLHSTAIGKVLLAWTPDDEVREILARVEFRPSTARTLGSAQALLAILPRVREQGYGEDDEEQEEGLRCLAAPIFNRFGNVVAALSISFPTMRCGANTKTHYVALLREAGQAISARIGYHGAWPGPGAGR